MMDPVNPVILGSLQKTWGPRCVLLVVVDDKPMQLTRLVSCVRQVHSLRMWERVNSVLPMNSPIELVRVNVMCVDLVPKS